jgi:quercetin dioxygenase-like cupin family protein
MEKSSKTYPEIGWFKTRFHVLEITDDLLEFECLMSGKGSAPPHFHKDCDEEFTALEGTLTVKVGKKFHILEPPNKIIAPKKEIHSLKNTSEDRIRFKVSMNPNNGMSSLFEILMFLKDNYPEKNYSIITAMYILKKLKLKEFSTPVGWNYYFEAIGTGIANILAPILGWPKLAKEFSKNILIESR